MRTQIKFSEGTDFSKIDIEFPNGNTLRIRVHGNGLTVNSGMSDQDMVVRGITSNEVLVAFVDHIMISKRE